jgi:hypothetical protein
MRRSLASTVLAVSVLAASGSPGAFAHGSGGGHGGGHSGGGGGGGYRYGYQSSDRSGYWGARTVRNWSGQGPTWFDPAAKVGFPEDMPLNRLHRFFIQHLPHLHPNAQPQK